HPGHGEGWCTWRRGRLTRVHDEGPLLRSSEEPGPAVDPTGRLDDERDGTGEVRPVQRRRPAPLAVLHERHGQPGVRARCRDQEVDTIRDQGVVGRGRSDVEDDLPPAPEPVEPDPAVLLVDEVLAVVAVDHGVVDIEPPRLTECRPGEDRTHADTSAGADPRRTTSTPA